MIEPAVAQGIERLANRYPSRESALIPALDAVQRAHHNSLTPDDVREVADLLKLPRSTAWGVATYYTMLNTAPVGTYHLQVDVNVPGMLMGADEVLAHLEQSLGIKAGETTADGRFTLSKVEDLGSCGTCPVIQVNDTYYENMTVDKVDALLSALRQGTMPPRQTDYHVGGERSILLKNRTNPEATTLAGAQATGAYQAQAKWWPKSRAPFCVDVGEPGSRRA